MLDASRTMDQYISELKSLEADLAAHIRDSDTLAPGGKNLKEAEYETLRNRAGLPAAGGRQPPATRP